MTDNPIRTKSYEFAIHVVALYKRLHHQHEFILSKQLLRSGTSIGANVEEAMQGQSKKDFISKLSIALKEANETHYWLRLLRDSGMLTPESATPMIADVIELLKLLTSIIKSSKDSALQQQE